jgi:hypothetical protein
MNGSANRTREISLSGHRKNHVFLREEVEKVYDE